MGQGLGATRERAAGEALAVLCPGVHSKKIETFDSLLCG
jgi:hypothetical protein